VNDFLEAAVQHLPPFRAALGEIDGARLRVPKTINFGAVEREEPERRAGNGYIYLYLSA